MLGWSLKRPMVRAHNFGKAVNPKKSLARHFSATHTKAKATTQRAVAVAFRYLESRARSLQKLVGSANAFPRLQSAADNKRGKSKWQGRAIESGLAEVSACPACSDPLAPAEPEQDRH